MNLFDLAPSDIEVLSALLTEFCAVKRRIQNEEGGDDLTIDAHIETEDALFEFLKCRFFPDWKPTPLPD